MRVNSSTICRAFPAKRHLHRLLLAGRTCSERNDRCKGSCSNRKDKRLGNVHDIESVESTYTPLTSAWQDVYIDGIFYLPIHAALPEQDLALRIGAFAV